MDTVNLAALHVLLKGRSEYHQPENPTALAPYKLERISLPESLHGLPLAEELLPDNARRYLQGPKLMLKETVDAESRRPYWDPVLANSRKHYREFIQRLDSIGLLQYTQTPRIMLESFSFLKVMAKRLDSLLMLGRLMFVLLSRPELNYAPVKGSAGSNANCHPKHVQETKTLWTS